MTVRLLTEQHLEFLSLIGGCTGSWSLFMSKCYIVGNHVSWLICSDCQAKSCDEEFLPAVLL